MKSYTLIINCIILLAYTSCIITITENPPPYKETITIEVQNVIYHPSSCLPLQYIGTQEHSQEIYPVGLLPELIRFKNITMNLYSEDGKKIEHQTCYNSEDAINCYFSFNKKGRYYLQSEEVSNGTVTILPFDTKKFPIEVIENTYNMIDAKYFTYDSFHGDEDREKDDYIFIRFQKNFIDIKEAPIISIKDNDTEKILNCSLSDIGNSVLECLIKENSFKEGIIYYGYLSTPCRDIKEVIQYSYKPKKNFLRVLSESDLLINKKCTNIETKVSVNIKYDLISKEEYPKDFSNVIQIKLNDTQFFEVITETDICTNDEKNKMLSCLFSPEEEGLYDIFCENFYNFNIVFRPFLFFNILKVDNRYNSPLDDGEMIEVNYSIHEEYEFNITFQESVEENPPEMKIDGIKLECSGNDKLLTCKFDYKIAPPPVIDYKIYDIVMSTVCGTDEILSTKINVTSIDEPEATLTLSNLLYEQKCVIYEKTKKALFTIDYKLSTYGGIEIKPFKFPLVNKEKEKIIYANCVKTQHGFDDKFQCTVDAPTIEIPTGKYLPKIEERIKELKYIINPFTAKEPLDLFTEITSIPIEPLEENKVIVNAEFKKDDLSYGFVITFFNQLNEYNKPKISINNIEISTVIDSKYKYKLNCFVLQEDFPYGENEKIKYEGTLSDYCGNDYYDIILYSSKKEEEPEKEKNTGLIVGISILAVIAVILIVLVIIFIYKYNKEKNKDIKISKLVDDSKDDIKNDTIKIEE